jgi:TetR/AcrR family transcriptional regulator, regulator of cefoperazone and chloramphenicol sensitivity
MRNSRRDGEETRQRLLQAACRVFAEEGYHDATVAGICRRAGANVAAVNYHFGSKEALYAEVWRQVFATFMQAYPVDGGLPPDSPVEERLYALVLALLHRPFDDGRLGEGFQLAVREMVSPTDVFADTWRELTLPVRTFTHNLIVELLGPAASRQQVLYCEISLINQCLSANFFKGRRKLLFGREHFSRAQLQELARHITDFSLGGIKAVRLLSESGKRKTGQ